jgi:hypothetical protein
MSLKDELELLVILFFKRLMFVGIHLFGLYIFVKMISPTFQWFIGF